MITNDKTERYTNFSLFIIFLVMTLLLLLSGSSSVDSASKVAAVCVLTLAIVSLILGKFNNMPKTAISPIVISTAAYLAIYTISLFYATTGQFALTVFSYYLGGISVFLLTIFLVNKNSANTRTLLLSLAFAVGIGGIFSIDAASVRGLTTVLESILSPLLQDGAIHLGVFESGTRMTSIIGNPNVFGSLAALATLASAYLFLSSRSKKEKNISTGLLIVNAVSLLYCFSLGSLISLLFAIIGFIVFSGKEERSRVVYVILATIITSFLSVFAGFSGMGKTGALGLLPLLSLLIFALVLVFLLRYIEQFTTKINALKRKNILIFSFLVLVIFSAVGFAAFTISDSYTFDASSGTLKRAVTLAPGADYQLEVAFRGNRNGIDLVIESQSYDQASTHTSSTLYSGKATPDPIAFTVPIESRICFINITAPDGTVIDKISVLNSKNHFVKSVNPDYLLLPTFIANRLQGLFVNENAAQRFVFFHDGMKIAAMSPVIGHGPGAFESNILSIQDYYYTTSAPHNHYIQTLDETGIVGLIAFLSIFACCIIALVKKIRTAENRALYSSLFAMLILLIIHTALELTFSLGIYNMAAFLIFALIAANYGQREAIVIQKKRGVVLVSKIAVNSTLCLCIVILVIYLGQFAAFQSVSKAAAAGDTAKFLDTLSVAAKLDFTNDMSHKSSYLAAYSPDLPEAYYTKAQKYAAELERHNSFGTLTVLVNYYAVTGQNEKAYQALNSRQALMRYDAAAWNATFDFYRQNLENVASSNSSEADINLIKKYASAAYEQLKAYQETSPLDIQLSEENQEFLEEVDSSTFPSSLLP